MLPTALFVGRLKTCIVVIGKNWRDHREKGDALYFASLCSGSVIFKRKGIPSRVAADNSKILIYGIDHIRIAVVVRWPTQDHYFPYFNRMGVSLIRKLKAVRPG